MCVVECKETKKTSTEKKKETKVNEKPKKKTTTKKTTSSKKTATKKSSVKKKDDLNESTCTCSDFITADDIDVVSSVATVAKVDSVTNDINKEIGNMKNAMNANCENLAKTLEKMLYVSSESEGKILNSLIKCTDKSVRYIEDLLTKNFKDVLSNTTSISSNVNNFTRETSSRIDSILRKQEDINNNIRDLSKEHNRTRFMIYLLGIVIMVQTICIALFLFS